MIKEIESLIDKYMIWLKDKTQLRLLDGAVEITTPYLDRHNDYLQIFAQKKDSGFVLSDDAYIINDLRLSGCDLDTPKRRELLNLTLNGFGVQLSKSDALIVKVTPDNFAVKKHDLLQAMLAINDLFFLAGPTVASIFLEDVASWLTESDIRYTSNIKIPGKSGYDHRFDFIIPKSRNAPERIIQTINKPTRDRAEALAFSRIEIRESRSDEPKIYAFLNDQDGKIPSAVIDALNNYEISPILWSQREKMKDELAA